MILDLTEVAIARRRNADHVVPDIATTALDRMVVDADIAADGLRTDIEAARDHLLDRGVNVSNVFHAASGIYAGPDEPYLFGRRRVSGPDPDHGSYRSFASFRDPDGNGWLFQEVTARLPGRIDSATTTFPSANDLANAIRRAAAAHLDHEKRIADADANWPDWYADYMVREHAGQPLPQ